MPCHFCSKVQTDPVRGGAPWARGVISTEQILVCPDCQSSDPTWTAQLARCSRCGDSRLSIVMGSVVCRACGYDSALP